jgi:hypothetical protein
MANSFLQCTPVCYLCLSSASVCCSADFTCPQHLSANFACPLHLSAAFICPLHLSPNFACPLPLTAALLTWLVLCSVCSCLLTLLVFYLFVLSIWSAVHSFCTLCVCPSILLTVSVSYLCIRLLRFFSVTVSWSSLCLFYCTSLCDCLLSMYPSPELFFCHCLLKFSLFVLLHVSLWLSLICVFVSSAFSL